MKKNTIYLLSFLLILALTACATSAAMTPTSASTATQRPSSTASPSLTPTMTQTPSPTPIPPTPEGAEGLTYDPDNRSLIDPQGTPIFSLDENNLWVEVVPEWAEEMEEEIEQEFGFEEEQVLVEWEGEGFAVKVGGEEVARKMDGQVKIKVSDRWRQARKASVDEEVWGMVYKAGGDYYKWYEGEGWREPKPVVIVEESVVTIQEGEEIVHGDEPYWNFMGRSMSSNRFRINLWANADRTGIYFNISNSSRLKGLAAVIEKEMILGGDEREYVRFLVSHPVSPENEEPFLFQVRVPIEHIQFDFFYEGEFKGNVAFTGKNEEFLRSAREQIKHGVGFNNVRFCVVIGDCTIMDWQDHDIWNLRKAEDAYIPRCEAIQEQYGDEMPQTNQKFVENFMEVWSNVYEATGVKGIEDISEYFEDVERGEKWREDKRVPEFKMDEWVLVSGVLEASDRESTGY